MQESGLAYTLKVNIEDKTTGVADGVALGLREERERRSDQLERLALFKGVTEVTALPPYLTLQMMRFFFRRDNQQKAKILKKVCWCGWVAYSSRARTLAGTVVPYLVVCC